MWLAGGALDAALHWLVTLSRGLNSPEPLYTAGRLTALDRGLSKKGRWALTSLALQVRVVSIREDEGLGRDHL